MGPVIDLPEWFSGRSLLQGARCLICLSCRRTMGITIQLKILLAIFVLTQTAHADPLTEVVVPGGPTIAFKDGRELEGHIVEIDDTEIVFLDGDGTERRMPRGEVEMIRFETLGGVTIEGALQGWKPGSYMLDADDRAIIVYSVTPQRPVAPADEAIAVASEPPKAAINGNGVDFPSGVGGPTEAIAEREPEQQAAALPPDQTADDAPIEIDIVAAAALENSEMIAFDVTLSRASSHSVVLIYATIDETAVDGEDYRAARGVLVIEAGETEARIEAEIIDDDISEDMERLRLFLTVDPTIAVVKNREIIATIEDDDG